MCVWGKHTVTLMVQRMLLPVILLALLHQRQEVSDERETRYSSLSLAPNTFLLLAVAFRAKGLLC